MGDKAQDPMHGRHWRWGGLWRWGRGTFRARLTATTALLAVGVLLVSNGLVYLSARRAMQINLDDALLSIAHTEVDSSLRRGGGQVPLALPVRSGYEKFAQVETADDRIIARTPNLSQESVLTTDVYQEKTARAGHITFSEILLRGERLRGIYYPTRDARGRPLLAVVAVSERPMQQALASLLRVLLLSLLAVGALAALCADRLARRLTGPLQQIARAARTVGEAGLSTRVPALSEDAEFRDVTAGLNEMLGRLESSSIAQQRFIADASHELRSPLSNLRGTVEVVLRRARRRTSTARRWTSLWWRSSACRG